MKHPGPWSWDPGEHAIMNTPAIVDAEGCEVVSAQDGISVGCEGDSREDEEATKRLILAAPELLALAEEVRDMNNANWRLSVRQKARALIARIEGE